MTLAAARITTYGSILSESALTETVSIYRQVYAEAPYSEGEADFRDFANSLPRRRQAPNFRLVLAHQTPEAVGFAMGHDLAPGTPWWDGATTPLDTELTTEYAGRTFAIIELAVLREHRRQGYAKALHAHLLAGVESERATLLVRPDAEPAHRAYESWSYHTVGRIRPFDQGPLYDAMIRPLV